jgi:hypothetical protein
LAKQFQERRLLEIDQAETRIAYGSHISSPLKPLGQMNQNLDGSIIGKSSLKIFI